MSSFQWAVLLLGAAAILWVNWYFFLSQRSTQSAVVRGSAQEVEIEVKGGYDPGVIRVKRGVPVKLVFNRQETSSCSEELVIPAFGVRRFLPPFERTTIEVTPREAGTFEITCGMSMLHGKLLVEG